MRIGVSAFAGDSGQSGISQYMKSIFKRLPELPGGDEYVLFMSESDREYFDFGYENVNIFTLPDWVGHPIINIIWHMVCLPLMLAIYRCDCVFLPAANRRLAWWYGIPSIGTVHDLSQLHVKAKYDPLRMFYGKKVLPVLMRRLTHVISVSQATQRDLVQHAAIDPGRVSVIYNGADLERFRPRDKIRSTRRMRERYSLGKPYILYTARLEHPGKNHVRLLQAFAHLKTEEKIPHHLVLAGSPWHGVEAIYDAARDFGLSQYVSFPGFIPEAELPDLYAGADLFVFPSLFEGFGIPLLEAMASGVPLCAANIASIPEVVQSAGILFDPTRVNEIQAAIARLTGDAELRRDLIRRGLLQSRLFSWDDSARQVLQQLHASVSTRDQLPKLHQSSK